MDYSYLYKKLNLRTPLKTDCGSLCENACCVDDTDEELGMYLFPGEEDMFKDKENFKVEESEFEYGNKKAKILFCKPFCNRKERPLSCRIFPLFPYITKDGIMKVIVDPRGRGICPLYKKELNEFNSAFVRGVRHIGEILISENECYKFLYELSRLIDEEIELILENYNKLNDA